MKYFIEVIFIKHRSPVLTPTDPTRSNLLNWKWKIDKDIKLIVIYLVFYLNEDVILGVRKYSQKIVLNKKLSFYTLFLFYRSFSVLFLRVMYRNPESEFWPFFT